MYEFTPSKINHFKDFPALSYLLKVFIVNYKDVVLNTHETMKKSIPDYTSGFEYLE